MFYLLTFLVFIPSPVVFFVSSEVWAVVVGMSGARPWWLVGPILGASQTAGFLLLYYFGGAIEARMPRLQAKLAQVDKSRLRSQAPAWLSLGGLTGIPPMVAIAMLSPLVGIRPGLVCVCSLVFRSIRFSALCAFPHVVAGWWPSLADGSALPSWLTTAIGAG